MGHRPGGTVRMGDLPPQSRKLVELMQDVDFGRITNLRVRDGIPVMRPRPGVVRVFKIGAEEGPRKRASQTDFVLKRQTVEFLERLRAMRNCTVLRVEVMHGLPRVVAVKDPEED